MRFDIGALPAAPLKAAATFHAEVLPLIENAMIAPRASEAAAAETDVPVAHDALPAEGRADDSLLLVFAPADATHRGWRLAVVQSLARAHAPLRINAVASNEGAAILAAEAYLDAAPGVTGQYWALDGKGAGPVLS